MLDEEELRQLEEKEDFSLPLSPFEHELLQRSVSSIDYLGDWSNKAVRDSIVLTCLEPKVVSLAGGLEFTCPFDSFTAERHEMHARIVDRMLTSPRTNRLSSLSPESAAEVGASSVESFGRRQFLSGQRESQEQNAYIVVGVPGSGKDTVIKRYLRMRGPQLLDASADLVKEYLAAWGSDELSKAVRENNMVNGPGKHLLHAQYLHRESIHIINQVVKRALEQKRSIMLEKTLHDSEHVLSYARNLTLNGYKVHLYGTTISPLKNWEFLRNRMLSGQAFGRYITKAQAISSLRQYYVHFSEIIRNVQKRRTFDSIYLYDVIAAEWCVAMPDTNIRYVEDEVEQTQT